jgi:hypothetical protein
MNLKKLALAAAAGTTLLAAAPVFAHSDWGPEYGWRGNYYRHHYYRPRVVYAPAPYYYAPRRVYYAPRPVYYEPRPAYYEPRPVIYGRIPLGHHSSVGFSLPLD